MATYLFKNKKYLIGLLVGLFFLPLFSSAQLRSEFIPTNAPCEPEIIPPLGQVEGVYCPYCSNKGEYLHLKWDLKANFQDPVCRIECWGPSGDQCYYWPTGRLFSDPPRNKLKLHLKPKDDVFVKRPTTGPRIGDGVNYQVSCWEKGDLSHKTEKRSVGIRVYQDDACGAILTVERRFSDIINDLNSYKPSLITETSLYNWSLLDNLDNTKKGSGNGSGDIEDIKSDVETRQDTEAADMTNYINDYENLNLGLLKQMKIDSQNKDASPLGLVFVRQYPASSSVRQLREAYTIEDINALRSSGILSENNEWNVWGVVHGLHAVVFLGIKSHDKDYSNFQMEILDPNFTNGSGLKVISCQKKTIQAKFDSNDNPLLVKYFKALLPDETIDKFFMHEEFSWTVFKEPGVFRNYYLCKYDSEFYRTFIPFDMDVYTRGGIDLNLARKNAVRQKTADYLRIPNNQLSFRNYGGGVCAGWTDFTLRVAYLGNFTGIDYHPDGTISKLFNNSRFLSAISLFSKDLTTKLFKLDK